MNTSSIPSQQQKAKAFRALHQQPGIFVAANPWDAGSARILESIGFKALATTSAGLAWSLGRPDGLNTVSRTDTLLNIESIVQATNLPLSADLENGFGDDPATCAETIVLAAQAGLCGGSIEDATGRPDAPIFPFEQAVERVKAAVAAARSLPYPFMLTARAENLIHGRPDLPDTIRRLEAFAEAGADVLFAPGLKTREEIETVVKAVAPKPVNVVMGLSGGDFSLEMLEAIGVKRVSVGSSFIRAAYAALFKAAEEVQKEGAFSYAESGSSYAAINQLFGKKK